MKRSENIQAMPRVVSRSESTEEMETEIQASHLSTSADNLSMPSADHDSVPRRLQPGGKPQHSSCESSLSDGSSVGLISNLELERALIQQPQHGTSFNSGNVRQVRTTRTFQRMETSSSSGSLRARSENSSNDWGYGWYEDVHNSETADKNRSNDRRMRLGLPAQPPSTKDGHEGTSAMAVTAPTYVLEESLSSQKLWKYTAGNRPPQPVEERAFYEKMWAQNFERSDVNYGMPVEVLTATSPISLNPFADYDGPPPATTGEYIRDPETNEDNATEAALISMFHDTSGSNELEEEKVTALPKTVPGSDGDLTVLIRGVNSFGTTVSKSFSRPNEKGGAAIETVNISIASYRVVENRKHSKYAQFLVIYRQGSIRDTVGVWKRYRDFEMLANRVTQAHEGCASVLANVSPLAVTEEPDTEHLPNAITSWRLLKKRQRWYRCLDSKYLSLKVFLLERFLHDILFESTSPRLLLDFVGAIS